MNDSTIAQVDDMNSEDDTRKAEREAAMIPLAVARLLAKGPWKYDEYALNQFAAMVEHHSANDHRGGLTCAYFLSDEPGFNSDMLTPKEFAAIVKAGAIDPHFHHEGGVNQHWLHSLMQFYAECTKAWIDHQERTKAILGTPAGRIYRKPE